MFRKMLVIGAAIVVAGGVAACGGGGDDDATPTPVPTATVEATATPASGATGLGGPIATGPSASKGKTFTAAQAQTIVDTVPIVPADLTSRWNIGTDTKTDAATAAANDATSAASIQRCQQLLSGLKVLSPPNEDLTSRYIGGEIVSYFTNLTVYATDEGATDCAGEAAAKYTSDPQELAKAFGSVFVDPAAVVIEPVEFPTVGEGSFASNLTGTVKAGDFEVSITILIVAWRQGNVTAVVGSAAAAAPPTSDLYPRVQLVAQRIADAQAQ